MFQVCVFHRTRLHIYFTFMFDVSYTPLVRHWCSLWVSPCSILYKAKLPFVVALNKIDVVDAAYVVEWMNDFEAFQEALEQVRLSLQLSKVGMYWRNFVWLLPRRRRMPLT